MEILSNLTMVQRLGAAGVVILLLLLLVAKQRKSAGGSAKAEKAPKDTAAKGTSAKAKYKPEKGAKREKRRSSFGRRKKDAVPEPLAETKAEPGRMVPRLPSAGEPAAEPFAEPLEPLPGEPVAAAPATAGGSMITEPGWPTPGDGWAADGASANGSAPAEHADAERGTAPIATTPEAMASHPPVDDAGWATGDMDEGFDPATGWSESEDAAAAPAATEPSWQQDEEPAWTADGDEQWDTPAAPAEADTWAADEEPVWSAVTEADEETQDLSWSSPEPVAQEDAAPDFSDWGAGEETPAAEPAEPATAFVWDQAAEEGAAGSEPTPAVVALADDHDSAARFAGIPALTFDPAAEDAQATPNVQGVGFTTAAEPVAAGHAFASADIDPVPARELAAPEAPVTATVRPEPIALPVPEMAPEAAPEPPFSMPAPLSAVEIAAEPVVLPVPEMAPEAAPEPPFSMPAPLSAVEIAAEPVVLPVPEMAPEAAPESEFTMPAPLAAVEIAAEVAEAPVAVEIEAQPVALEVAEAPAGAGFPGSGAGVLAASVANPVGRWAGMAPSAPAQMAPANPTERWAQMRPAAAGASNGAALHAPAPAAPAALVGAPIADEPASQGATRAVAWWDLPAGEDEGPLRGRFALGGYAIAPGHQVVSGVTFREGVVPPPSAWLIGPVVGAVAPGTLVLEVDGCLNCAPEDVAVLMDRGFAPTPDGFSLRLSAREQGPFAASGTYVIH